MSLEEFLKWIHVLAAIAWVGGSFALVILVVRASVTSDAGLLKGLIRQSDFFGRFVFNIAGILVLVAGIWLVIESPVWDWDQAFISIGFAGVAVGIVLGMGFYPRQWEKVDTALEDGGIESSGVGTALATLRNVAAAEIAVLVVVVWAMVTKPGL
ncbi:MAG: DUF2269 family protein [Acidimicrobiia bacterium]|nr:DUF2269 family protein [Acidimicrobiia bacterium]